MIQKGVRLLRTYAWLLPFICFVGGYYAASSWIDPVHVTVPSIVGSNVLEGFSSLARLHLNMRLLEERHHEDVAEGTVLEQHPAPGSAVRLHHHVYVVIARKPPQPPTPDFLGKTIQDIRVQAQKNGVKTELYYVSGGSSPEYACFAQYPAPHTPINKKTDRVIGYIAPRDPQWHVMPDLIGQNVSVAQVLGAHKTVRVNVVGRDGGEAVDGGVVVEQVPRAGELVDLRKNVQVQLLVS